MLLGKLFWEENEMHFVFGCFTFQRKRCGQFEIQLCFHNVSSMYFFHVIIDSHSSFSFCVFQLSGVGKIILKWNYFAGN